MSSHELLQKPSIKIILTLFYSIAKNLSDAFINIIFSFQFMSGAIVERYDQPFICASEGDCFTNEFLFEKMQ